mgnify:CR=1 FL=1
MGSLPKLLREKNVLLLDGATGTNLFDLGLESGDTPKKWNLVAKGNYSTPE